jgi:hypothetical protein
MIATALDSNANFNSMNQVSLEKNPSLAALVCAAMEKIGSKQLDHELLPEGSQHVISLTVSGDIDGQAFFQSFNSQLTIGHDHTKATSATPQQPQLLGYILGKLNQKTRDKILREIPEDFTNNDCVLPEVSQQLLTSASEFLKQLRSHKTVNARRSVRCNFTTS